MLPKDDEDNGNCCKIMMMKAQGVLLPGRRESAKHLENSVSASRRERQTARPAKETDRRA
jgi:hypothetical protein